MLQIRNGKLHTTIILSTTVDLNREKNKCIAKDQTMKNYYRQIIIAIYHLGQPITTIYHADLNHHVPSPKLDYLQVEYGGKKVPIDLDM